MAITIVNIHDVPQAIQLALGPVFLLTGIAGMLNVMTGRLARIVDRGRQLSENLPSLTTSQTHLAPAQLQALIDEELNGLERRRHLASAAITACTFAALGVCMVIASLFLEVMLSVPLNGLVGLLFTASTLSLVVGLAYFMREVHLSNGMVRFSVGAGRAADPGSG